MTLAGVSVRASAVENVSELAPESEVEGGGGVGGCGGGRLMQQLKV